MKKYFLLIIIVLCILLSGGLYLFAQQNPAYDLKALQAANLILALLTVIGYLMVRKQQKNDSAHAFVRGVYSATLLKLMVCMGGIFGYAMLNKAHLHKPTVFTMLGIYFLYTMVETTILSRVVKKNN